MTSATVDSGGEEELATSEGAGVTGIDGADDIGTELDSTCEGTEGAGEVPGTDGVVAFLDGKPGADAEGIGK